MEIKFVPCHHSNYQRNRISKIQYIVIHYTGNDGDTALSNCRYFQSPDRKASAHYFVDSNSVYQSVKDNDVAWHCGGKTYKHPTCRNTNSIGIEICDDVRDKTIYPSEKTIQNALELTYYIMKKYGIPKENVIRHYDVTGKLCPAFWVDNQKWKTEFLDRLGGEEMVEKIPMIVDNKTYQVERILKDGTNFIKIRDIATILGLQISNNGNIPVLNSGKNE